MKVVYSGEHEVEVPALGLIVKPGEVIEVADEAAEGLVHQSLWAVAPEPTPEAKSASKPKKEADA